MVWTIRQPPKRVPRPNEAATLIDVAVLNALADDGAIIVGSGQLLHALALARAAHQDWEAAGRQGAPHFLELVSIRGKPFAPRVAFSHQGYPVPHQPAAIVSTIVNLSQIFARLPLFSQLREAKEADSPA
jgi:hypothetical protein